MTSTFLSYRTYANNFTQSLQRVAAQPDNAKDQAYFEANITKVKSVDDFLNNYRLFTYAMKAYGLESLGNAKALMKQVLESDLSNSNSVANRFNDSRYTAFAKAFNFTATGKVAGGAGLQTASQQQDLFSRMNLSASDQASLGATLSKIGSVDALEADSGLYTSIMSAFGLDPKVTSKAEVAIALTSDAADPLSAVNRPDVGKTTTYAKLRALAADFNFASDGLVGGQTRLQSAQGIASTQAAYLSKAPTDAKAQAAASAESAYYAKTLPTLTSVDQIVSDSRLVAVLKSAFGLDTKTLPQQIRGVLTSNLLDPKSVANTLGVDPKKPSTTATPYQLLAGAFNVGPDGTAWDHSGALSAATLASVTTAYTTASIAAAGTNKDAIKTATAAAQTETNYFVGKAGTLTSVDSLVSDPRLVAYLRTAFSLPAPVAASGTKAAVAGTTVSDLTAILKSDVLDPTSAANTKGSNARKLATSFNFASDGLVYAQRPIQSAARIAATTAAYQGLAGTTAPAKAAAQAETDYYTSTIPRVKSVDDLIADKRLIAYLTTAYNLPATPVATLKQALTSNLLDPKGKANVLGGGYATFAAAFDVSSDGTISRPPDRQVQDRSGIVATHAAYLEQMMESEAGDQYGDGVRLALYFKKVAPTVTTAYGILADKALTKVVQTALGLSSDSSKADVDSQARYITSKLNIADFKDPVKLDKMIARFTALYDLTNTSNADTENVKTLYGSS